jgi:hypothetical protein
LALTTWAVSHAGEGRELVGGSLSAEKVRDLADHPVWGLGRLFMLEERPDPVAELLLGALDRSRVLFWLGGQFVHTS